MEIQKRDCPFHFKSWKEEGTFLNDSDTGARSLKISSIAHGDLEVNK